ncbi:MAG: RNA polymerase sporulation sigma factor SigG [Clostridia bacterium]|nr:RNA polymerase sporulation sigma factor SigG [Clostridia bacterium]
MSYGYYGKVEICGVNTAHLKTLTPEENNRLLTAASKGDREARQRLIDGNLRLVLSIVQRFSGRGENLDDLFQVGCIGLIKAIDRFDVSCGVQLSTYAVPMIIGELRRYLRDNNTIRVSRGVRDLAYRALQVREELSQKKGCEIGVEEIAAVLGEKTDAVSAALDAIADPVSLYEPVYSDGGDSIFVMDQIGDTDNTDEDWLENIALRDAMQTLTPRERKIISMRFYADRTQMEIAEEIGISQAQVSRLEKGALQRIRARM